MPLSPAPILYTQNRSEYCEAKIDEWTKKEVPIKKKAYLCKQGSTSLETDNHPAINAITNDMNHGKDICNELKAVRQSIANENGIPFETKECTYQGECRGTCPRCEAELRQLEAALAGRLSMGKVATVAGLMLSLAAGAQAQEVKATTPQQPIAKEMTDSVTLKRLHGSVLTDDETKEPILFANVTIHQDGKLVTGTLTNIDGEFTLKPFTIRPGKYQIRVSCVGYSTVTLDMYTSKPQETVTISMKTNALPLQGVIVTGMPDFYDPDATQNMEIQGVKVIVR